MGEILIATERAQGRRIDFFVAMVAAAFHGFIGPGNPVKMGAVTITA